MSAIIFIEGGGDAKDLTIRCREGFHKLLDRCGITGRKPRFRPCGGRAAVFDAFSTAHSTRPKGEYVAMLIDSEEPLADIEAAWKHLQEVETVPRWKKPKGAGDEQVMFMTTCMETWIVADRATLKQHYRGELQEAALPPLVDLEQRTRHDVQDRLAHATRNCRNAYAKGKRSYEVLGKLEPGALRKHLPSFVRVCRILEDNLRP